MDTKVVSIPWIMLQMQCNPNLQIYMQVQIQKAHNNRTVLKVRRTKLEDSHFPISNFNRKLQQPRQYGIGIQTDIYIDRM